jgi:hypothetical protein
MFITEKSFEDRSRIKSSLALPIINKHPKEDIIEAMKKHSAYCVTVTSDDIKPVKNLVIVETEKEEEGYDDDMFDDMEVRCECGIKLTKGWQCENCRVNCPDCNRALTKNPEDYCTRCNIKCLKHGLFKLSLHKSCPQCRNKT